MPEMDGYEATRRIREIEAERGIHTPVLAMTASVLESDRQRCEDAGMDDMLSKPFQPHRMVEWLEGWLLEKIRENGGACADGNRASRESSADTDSTLLNNDKSQAVELEVRAPLPASAQRDEPESGEGAEGSIDASVLGSLLDDEEGRILASELVDSFLQLVPGRLSELENAARTANLESAASIAHGLVSTSGTVGAVRLAELLRQVERFAGSGNTDDSLRLIERCRDEIEVARLALVQGFC